MTNIDGLRETLSTLAANSQSNQVFGAASHHFRLNTPVSPPKLDVIELRLGCKLPTEYRAFLTDAGNGGAGPGYGLWPAGRWDPTNQLLEPIEPPNWPDAPSEPFPHSKPWNASEAAVGPSPRSDADDTEHDQYHAKLDQVTWAAGNANGALPIADLGCAIRLLLVVTGPERNHIWIDDRANDGGIYPASLPGRDRLTFTHVYHDWLSQSITFCETEKREPRPW